MGFYFFYIDSLLLKNNYDGICIVSFLSTYSFDHAQYNRIKLSSKLARAVKTLSSNIYIDYFMYIYVQIHIHIHIDINIYIYIYIYI